MKPFLDLLPDGVADWMVRRSGERRFAEGDLLIREGEVPAAIFMLLEGVLDATSADGRRLARLGPGNISRLFEASDFHRPCTQITFEAEGIDLFAECVKEV